MTYYYLNKLNQRTHNYYSSIILFSVKYDSKNNVKLQDVDLDIAFVGYGGFFMYKIQIIGFQKKIFKFITIATLAYPINLQRFCHNYFIVFP